MQTLRVVAAQAVDLSDEAQLILATKSPGAMTY